MIKVVDSFDGLSNDNYNDLLKLVGDAIKKGTLHNRPNGWLCSILERQEIRVIYYNDKLIGMFVLEEICDDKNEPIVYGSSALWVKLSKVNIDLLHDIIIRESKNKGVELFGAFYVKNRFAEKFYSKSKGWRYEHIDSIPLSVKKILIEHKDEIQIISYKL